MPPVLPSHAVCQECGLAVRSGWEGMVCPSCALGLALEVVEGLEDKAGGTEPAISGFGDYEIMAELGRGGMGVVYRAHQRSLNRPVAIKMLLAGQLASAESLQRFRMEAEAAARLHHPNVLPVYEVGEHETFHYFSMRLVEPSRTIAALACGDHPTPGQQRRAAQLMSKVAGAVAFAHSHGVLHRDLKPANVLVDPDDEPFVTDFGLAKILHTETDSKLTLTTAVLGSPGYLAPEQATGSHADVSTATDVYGLGAILYELLTGRAPFRAGTAIATLREVVENAPAAPRLLRPEIHPDLERICLKCLEKLPAHRYSSAAEVMDELDRFGRGEPVRARPVPGSVRLWRWGRRHPLLAGWISAAVLAVLLGVTGVIWQWREAVTARQTADRRAAELSENLYFSRIDGIVKARSHNDFGLARALFASLDSSGVPDGLRGLEWRILKGLCRGDERALGVIPNQSPGTALAWTPDGSRICVITAGGEVQLWDPEHAELKEHWQLEDGASSAWSRVQFTPDGRMAAITGSREIRVISMDRKTVLREPGAGQDCAWHEDGRLLVAKAPHAPDAGGIWELSPGAPDKNGRRCIAPGLQPPLAVSVTGDAAAAAVSADTYRVWNLDTGSTIRDIRIEVRGGDAGAMVFRHWQITRLALSPDGRYAAAAWLHPGHGAKLMVHAPAENQAVAMETFSEPPDELRFAPNEDALLVAEHGAADLRRIRYLLNRPKEQSAMPDPGRPHYPVFDDHCEQPDAAIATGNLPLGLPRRYFTRSAYGGRTQFLLGHEGPVTAAAWDPAGKTIASVSRDATLRLWDEPVWNVSRIAAAVNMPDGVRPAMSEDGEYFVYLRGVFDVSPVVQIRGTGVWKINGQGHPVAVFPDATAVFYERSGRVSLQRIAPDATLSEIWHVEVPEIAAGDDPRTPAGCVAYAAGKMAAGIAAHRVFSVNCATREVRVSDPLPLSPVDVPVDMCASPGWKYLALTGFGPRALLLDARSLKAAAQLRSPVTAADECVCFGPGGNLYSGGTDGVVRVWDAASGAELREWRAHDAPVAGLAMHPGGQGMVSSGGLDLRIWDADGGRLRCSLPVASPLNWLKFSSDGNRLFQSGVWMALEGWDIVP